MAIEQHPIPQDVAGYKFRLIGEMTVKQFIWLAGGIILGLITFSLPLPFFFKYPLTGIFVALGAGIAFLPVEGRPMDKWLIAFIKSVYSPTEYTWQKSEGVQGQPSVTTAKITPHVVVPAPATRPAAPAPVVTVATPTPIAPTPVAPTPPVVTPAIPTAPKPVAPTPAAPAPSGNLPIPFTPTTPNTLVGMTLTAESKILDGCLVEIKSNGVSIRATKSNQLGQFLFAKPLENGNFQIFTEKTGYTFDTYSLTLTGQIVKPLRLQAKP
ncbi:hypothetical protein A3A84_00685 [Candidatus Collierbacteria bacterium RIFCSPLOWO2_01_FULL_50_23]|uniref:PrgI family protein n=1 Tax=Candidatus Collierbacteria bacterium RIFCSPHIGHO2_01_FULL_50_25 TaxID=1817722 RepID=A0A1F5EWP3_9BACT|nr:MAG: hypothetical protein A2703_00390 [Candidatus Collierbacteria bacterium RIFCSPHIGHO2_01_FULL_50_25]OGD74679.1 MAG: hypothetical protein A3A84_00685 [Candidatus Collierbacteria bacterium RIFCSPLOWO2_01_FULL_50_23]